jgi:hypothetical protein
MVDLAGCMPRGVLGQVRSVLADGQLEGHQLGRLLQPVHRVHHDREADQFRFGIPAQDVYALDVDAIKVGLELQHGTHHACASRHADRSIFIRGVVWFP